MINLAGWISSICFSISGIPAVYEAIQISKCLVPTGTLVLWTIGEICAIIYIFPKRDKPLMTNYCMNIIVVATLWYYKYL